MKNTILKNLAVAAMVAVPGLFAADIQVGDSTSGYGIYQTGQGGEFTLHVLNNSLDTSDYDVKALNQGNGSQPSFQTFCVEGGETIYPYAATYDVTISQQTIYSGKTLNLGAAWLYYEFATGNLTGYNYGVGRTGSAGLLQKAIWAFMTEEGLNTTSEAGNIFVQAAIANFGGDPAAHAANNGTIPVYILNLWVPGKVGTQAGKRQDQLYLNVPDGGMTIALLGLAVVGLASFRRRIA